MGGGGVQVFKGSSLPLYTNAFKRPHQHWWLIFLFDYNWKHNFLCWQSAQIQHSSRYYGISLCPLFTGYFIQLILDNKELQVPHTSIFAKLLANSFCSSSSTQMLNMSNEQGGCSQSTLSQSSAKVSAIIITVCTQSGCVPSYSLSQSSGETRKFGTDFPRGQDSPNIRY